MLASKDLAVCFLNLDACAAPLPSPAGLSRMLDPSATHAVTRSVGTISHAAPELLATGTARHSADVYAFGICRESHPPLARVHGRITPAHICHRQVRVKQCVFVECHACEWRCVCHSQAWQPRRFLTLQRVPCPAPSPCPPACSVAHVHWQAPLRWHDPR